MAHALRDRDTGMPLFGRAELHEQALQRLAEARSGRGTTLLLVGEAGVGKSTILGRIAADAEKQGFEVLRGRGIPSDLPQPFRLMQEVLRSAHPLPGTGPLEGASEAASLPIFLAPVPVGHPGEEEARAAPSDRLADTSAEIRRLTDHLVGPPERVEQVRVQLHARIGDYLAGLAGSRPLLLALDDLHFSDDSSLGFLEDFSARIANLPVAIVGTSLPEAGPPSRLAGLLEKWSAGGRVGRLEVPPLDEEEFTAYVRWLMHGRDPGAETTRRWFTQTEGNPLFGEEVVRGAVGLATGSPPETRGTPAEFEEVLRARIQSLSEPERRLVVYAAVLGKEFEFPVLAAAIGVEEERLSEALDRLVQGGILREQGGEVYEFVSERARAEVYSQLTETRRRILHRKVARALEARGSASPAVVHELARQFYLGRDEPRAVEYNRRAATLALEASAFDTAVVHLERALEAARRLPARDPHGELTLLLELGRVLDEEGNLTRSESVLGEAVDRARAPPLTESELALALLWLARTRYDLGRFALARELGREAYRILSRQNDERGLLIAHKVLGTCSWRLGEFDEAEQHLREELRLAEKLGDERERGHATVDLANALIQRGSDRGEEAMALYESAARSFASSGDASLVARVLMNRAVLLHGLGRHDEATRVLREATEAAERSRSRMWIGYCRLNEAQFRIEGHDAPGAREALARSRQVLASLGDALALQQIAMIEAMVETEEGHFDAADQRYDDAMAQARALGLGPEVAEARFRSARVALARGDRDGATRRLAKALEEGLLTLHAELRGEVEAFAGSIGFALPGAAAMGGPG